MNPDVDRERLRAEIENAEQQAASHDVDAANTTIEATRKITTPWESEGRLTELLRPLIDAREPQPVRYYAASELLQHGDSDHAVPVLEELRDGDGRHRQGTAGRRAEAGVALRESRPRSHRPVEAAVAFSLAGRVGVGRRLRSRRR